MHLSSSEATDVATLAEQFAAVSAMLDQLNITVDTELTDLSRPWGGFFVIDQRSNERFVEHFFPGYSYADLTHGRPVTLKILVVGPGQQLSWQYHNRRAEFWRVLQGPVGVITSTDDTLGNVQTVPTGDIVEFGAGTRHRLIGLDGVGLVAEAWQHTDPSNPSVEADIIRVQDDYARG